jgi:hypothetical protein
VADGVLKVDAWFITFSIIIPITTSLLDFLLTPYFMAKAAGCFIESYTDQTLVVRYSFIVYFMVRVAVYILPQLSWYCFKNFVALCDMIRDKKYLLGTELSNR